jgi:hypothetical protein
MPVKTLAERLPYMPTNKRHQLAQRATTWVEDKCGKAYEGAQALGDIATFERRLYADRRIYVGALHWEPHDGQWLMRGFDGADEVAGLCCANQLTDGSPLSPDGFIPRLS